ncbi:MAG: hypothetical protein JXR40_11635 [Pontiellaceae bacterium]|nr:hypothetical protein [Pontiellaceae bacterium]
MGKAGKKSELGCIDLLENAVQLLRATPLSVWLGYYIGAVPFILGLLFFIADMSTSAFAEDHCVTAALGLALLYVWMRFRQARFCRCLQEQEGFFQQASVAREARLQEFLFYLITSAWVVVLYPVAWVLMMPVPWATAYLNSLCIVDGSRQSIREASGKAWAAARIQPIQNIFAGVILSLFGTVVALNLTTVGVRLPQLIKSLLGIETPLAQHYYWAMNPTFIGIILGLTYLIVDPLVKAVYVLRFSAFESIPTGRDILLELKRIPVKRRTKGVARMGAILLLFGCVQGVQAAAPETTAPVSIEQMDQSLDRTMKEREFVWRMPREKVEQKEFEKPGWFERWMERIDKFFDRLFKRKEKAAEERDFDPKFSKHKPLDIKSVMTLLLIVLLGGGLVFLIRSFRRKNRPPAAAVASAERALPTEVDLDDANLTATLLEEDEWIELARSLALSGDLRKAVRAWFLAGLAYLARVNLLTVRPAKSNRDYRWELARRARRRPNLIPVFSEHIVVFERIWYGLHSVLPGDIDQMEINMEKLRNDTEE